MKIRTILAAALPAFGAALLWLASASAGARAGSEVDNPDTLAEQAAALAAESEAAPAPDLDGLAFPGGDYPLFTGVDDVNVPTYRIDPTTNISATVFTGFSVWGAAYDDVDDRVFFNFGMTLYEWPVGGVPATLGTIVDEFGSSQAMVGLAFNEGQLFSTKNIANEAVWKIDPDTLIAAVYIDYVDADLDAGGLAIDQSTGLIYAANDDTTPYGAGLVRINPDATVTFIAPYPAGQTDIDGLAVGDGIAYLVTDEPGFIYVYDIEGGAYLPPLENPWTTTEAFSAGAWIPGETVVLEPDIHLVPDNLSSSQPADTVIDQILSIRNVGAAVLDWILYEDNLPGLGPAGSGFCNEPEDIPWLSTDPADGSTDPDSRTDVTVTFDSTGLSPGVYTADLCIHSNDPDESLLAVPVSLTVLEGYPLYLPIVIRQP